ncbi:unnamed protein product, partial [Coregonus sp. 'balchen']
AVQSVSVLLELQDVLVRTGLKDRSRLLLGPFSCSAALEARDSSLPGQTPSPTPIPNPFLNHQPHPELPPQPPAQSSPYIVVHCHVIFPLVSVQVFWGQEHVNCLRLVYEHIQAYLQRNQGTGSESGTGAGAEDDKPAFDSQSPPSPGSPSSRTEHSSDDLRTGLFQYIQDSGNHHTSLLTIHLLLK